MGVAIVAAASVNSDDVQFTHWIKQFNKVYSSDEERQMRFHNFQHNLRMIETHSQQQFTMNLNGFADMSHEEFISSHKPVTQRRRVRPFVSSVPVKALPNTFDWRQQGAVPPVGNQGQCGASDMAAAISIESCHFVSTGVLAKLNLQQAIQCSSNSTNGCQGGGSTWALLEWVQQNNISIAAPPVQNISCNTQTDCGSTLTNVTQVTPGSESSLQVAVFTTPIPASIDASQTSFQFYNGGIYNDPNCSTTQLDHTVLVVGWGSDANNNAYWICQNTWGPDWGMAGYFLLARNAGNACGIATSAYVPTGCNNC